MAKGLAARAGAPLRSTKKVTKAAKAKRLVGRGTLRSALVSGLKEQCGRTDLKFDAAPKVASKVLHSVPPEQRAGYPLTRPKGSVEPRDWRTSEGVKVEVDFTRPAWMPDDWGQGVKTTNPTSHSTGGGGGTLTSYVAPDGKVFYHKRRAEEYAGRTFGPTDGFNGQVRLAKLQAKQAVQLARIQIKDDGSSESQTLIGTDPDASFFKLLSAQERKCLPKEDGFHFCVVSARRATTVEGVRDIWMVQSQFVQAGVNPTWYVDEQSLKDYQCLGLRAVVGGKLTASRNKALRDARRLGKACVQVSDDIAAWEYREGKNASERTDDAVNAAHAAARRYIVSPVAAARFILAKMRGVSEGPQPQLGGVYMLGSCSRTFAGAAISRHHFILGDFFVVDTSSKVLFDEEMRLKEDYDFSCSHIRAHGSVMRFNRMTLNVKHYANSGGACTNRDKKGEEERRNIAILHRKWPGCFRPNPKRKNEVIMKWRLGGDDAEADDDEGCFHHTPAGRAKAAVSRSTPARKKVCMQGKSKKRSAAFTGLPLAAVLRRTSKDAKVSYIAQRCRKVAGQTVGHVLAKLRVRDGAGNCRAYLSADLRYDLKCGYLSLERGARKACK